MKIKSNYLCKANLGKNNWWRYLFTLTISCLGGILGGILCYFIAPFIYLELPTNIPKFLNIPTDIPTLCSLLFLFASVYLIHKRSPITILTSYKTIQWKNIFKGMFLWILIMNMSTLVYFAIYSNSFKFNFDPNIFGWLIIASMLTIPILAFSEEVFFRGYLLQGFSIITRRPIIPLILTSIIFGLLHSSYSILGIFNLIRSCLFGLMLGMVVICEEGLETAIGIHVINNLYLILICSEDTTLFGNIPSIFTIDTGNAFSMINYSFDLIIELIQIITILTILFWGKLHILKNIFKGNKFDKCNNKSVLNDPWYPNKII